MMGNPNMTWRTQQLEAAQAEFDTWANESLLHRAQIALIHQSHWAHKACEIAAALLSHVGHGHFFGLF